MALVGVAEITAQREAIAGLVRDYDEDCLTPRDCGSVVADTTAMINMLEGVRARAAAKLAGSSLATESGAPDAATDLAARLGTSKGAATKVLDTGARLRLQPVLNEAVTAGTVSLDQAALISDAAAANPARERDLVATAGRDSLKGLKDACDRAKAAADPDPAATADRVHRERRFRMWTDGDVAKVFGQCTKAQILAIRAAIDTKTDQLFAAARAEGRREPREAYAMDAFEAICTEWLNGSRGDHDESPESSPNGKCPQVTMIVRADYTALVRGRPVDGEICEIDGLGPIDVPTARNLLGEALLYLVITKGTAVHRVVNLKRSTTIAQQIALAWQSAGRCPITSCDQPRLEIHHTEPWAETKHTVLDELETPCLHHHELITAGWTMRTNPDGTITIHPPDDP
jgi:hypothetical protein